MFTCHIFYPLLLLKWLFQPSFCLLSIFYKHTSWEFSAVRPTGRCCCWMWRVMYIRCHNVSHQEREKKTWKRWNWNCRLGLDETHHRKSRLSESLEQSVEKLVWKYLKYLLPRGLVQYRSATNVLRKRTHITFLV